jgi:serine/threonine protein kinase
MSIKIDGYEILEKAGGTTDTTIWTARQISLDRNVSIWVLKDRAAADENLVNHFSMITRAMSRLKHNNFPAVIDISATSEGIPYIVFENADSASVGRVIKENGPYTVKHALSIAKEVAIALDVAWKQAGLVHRNLKPDNIYIASDGAVKIFNFNSATIVQPGVNPLAFDDGMVVGTPNFASPEQIDCLPSIDYHADMYGLGATLYHMLTGKAPFDSERDPMRILELQRSGHLPNPKAFNANIPDEVVYIMARLMAKHPEDRYPWWLDFVEDIERVLSGKPLRMVPPNGVVRSTIDMQKIVSAPLVVEPAAPVQPIVISPIIPTNNAPISEGYSETIRNPQQAPLVQPVVPNNQPIIPTNQPVVADVPPAPVKKIKAAGINHKVSIKNKLYPNSAVVFFTRVICLAIFLGGIYGIVVALGPAGGVKTTAVDVAAEEVPQESVISEASSVEIAATKNVNEQALEEYSSFEEDDNAEPMGAATAVETAAVVTTNSPVENETTKDTVVEETPREVLLRKAYNELATKSISEARIQIKKIFDENASTPGVNRAELRGILAALNAAKPEYEAVGLALVKQTQIAFKKITIAGKTFEVKALAYANGEVICNARKVGSVETRKITIPLNKASAAELYNILRTEPDGSKEMLITKSLLALRANNRGDFLRHSKSIKALQVFYKFVK